MALIQDTFNRPMDPAYETVARERESRGLSPATQWGKPTVIVGALLIGLLIGMAGSSLRQRADSVSAARVALISQIRDRQAVADDRSASIRQLQEEISELEASAISPGVAATGTELGSLRLATGSQAVSGPGVVVTLDNGPDPGEAQGQSNGQSVNTVAAADLQWLTNALWEAGAEAIAVNGHRLTSRSAIRSAGAAILVNFRPLSPPYTISAIGDPKQMVTTFASGPGGAYLGVLRDNYGIVVDTSTKQDITLRGAVIQSLRAARVSRENGGGSSPGTSSAPTTGSATP